jgi:hypothetical protein
MQSSLDVMKIALRVLTDINSRRDPDPKDVQALRDYAPGAPAENDLLACEVIQKALANRAKARVQVR